MQHLRLISDTIMKGSHCLGFVLIILMHCSCFSHSNRIAVRGSGHIRCSWLCLLMIEAAKLMTDEEVLAYCCGFVVLPIWAIAYELCLCLVKPPSLAHGVILL